ncbi:MAG: energy transducer TonB [Opitutales bacterium]
MPQSLTLLPPTYTDRPAAAVHPRGVSTPQGPTPFKSSNDGYKKPLFFREPDAGHEWFPASTMALVVSATIFLCLPFTQWLASLADDLFTRPTVVAEPPPPALPPEPEPIQEKQKEEVVKPELKEAPPPISLTQLESLLVVGSGMGAGFSVGEVFADYQVMSMDDMIYEIQDLDSVPNLISARMPIYPYELKRNKVEGKVELLVLINEEGRVRVLNVKSATHQGFVEPAIQAASSARYTPPKRNGEAVKVRYYLPFTFNLDDL